MTEKYINRILTLNDLGISSDEKLINSYNEISYFISSLVKLEDSNYKIKSWVLGYTERILLYHTEDNTLHISIGHLYDILDKYIPGYSKYFCIIVPCFIKKILNINPSLIYII